LSKQSDFFAVIGHTLPSFVDNNREANAWLAEEGYGKAD
jgi:hypothetical protein